MEIPDGIVAGLRAYLVDDQEECRRLLAPFEAEQHPGLVVLVAAAVIEAAERKFGTSGTIADVVRYVAELRTRERPSDIDPFPAERVLRGALGDSDALVGLDDETKLDVQLSLLDELVTRAGPTGEGMASEQLDDLLVSSRVRAEAVRLES